MQKAEEIWEFLKVWYFHVSMFSLIVVILLVNMFDLSIVQYLSVVIIMLLFFGAHSSTLWTLGLFALASFLAIIAGFFAGIFGYSRLSALSLILLGIIIFSHFWTSVPSEPVVTKKRIVCFYVALVTVGNVL